MRALVSSHGRKGGGSLQQQWPCWCNTNFVPVGQLLPITRKREGDLPEEVAHNSRHSILVSALVLRSYLWTFGYGFNTGYVSGMFFSTNPGCRGDHQLMKVWYARIPMKSYSLRERFFMRFLPHIHTRVPTGTLGNPPWSWFRSGYTMQGRLWRLCQRISTTSMQHNTQITVGHHSM